MRSRHNPTVRRRRQALLRPGFSERSRRRSRLQRPPHAARRAPYRAGLTLIELIVVMMILAICALPLLQMELAGSTKAFADWTQTQLILAILYTTPAWAAAVLIFILDSYRAEAMQEHPASWLKSAMQLGALGLLTSVIALVINPVVQEVSLTSLLYLALAGTGVGLICGGLFWPLLSNTRPPQNEHQTTTNTTG